MKLRAVVCILWLFAAPGARADEDWQSILAQMPLRTNVTELTTFNYVNVVLSAFQSNDTVKALVFLPGAVDTFFWHRETKVLLTNASPTLLDAVSALTNQTRIRATFRPPLLLLHFSWDPLTPDCEIRDGAMVDKLRQRRFLAHALYNDKDWDFTLPALKKATRAAIAPGRHSRYSYHFYRSSFAAWNLTAWEAVQTFSLATRTTFLLEHGRITFKEDERHLAEP